MTEAAHPPDRLPGELIMWVLIISEMAVFGAALLIFLVLAALYESWSIPLSVILVVPLGLLGAGLGLLDMTGQLGSLGLGLLEGALLGGVLLRGPGEPAADPAAIPASPLGPTAAAVPLAPGAAGA